MNKNRDKISLFGRVKWAFYDLKVKLFGGRKTQKVGKMNDRKRQEKIFLFFFLLLPIVQFLIFYVGVAGNTLKLAFQSYNVDTGKYYFAGFKTFGEVIKSIFVTGNLKLSIKNSAIQFLVGLVIGMPLQIMVAYVVFKEVPFAGLYKVLLFMPNIISSLVFVTCARSMIVQGFPVLFNNPDLRLLNTLDPSSFYTVLVFGLWMNFAGGLIIYLSAMCSISKDIMEYGQLENMSSLKEFWYVVLPSIFPTVVTYIVVAVAVFFTNYGHFYSFFGGDGGGEKIFSTLGYYFFVKVAGGTYTMPDPLDFPFVSAAGIMFTVIVAPVTLLTKYLLEKYGPSED